MKNPLFDLMIRYAVNAPEEELFDILEKGIRTYKNIKNSTSTTSLERKEAILNNVLTPCACLIAKFTEQKAEDLIQNLDNYEKAQEIFKPKQN